MNDAEDILEIIERAEQMATVGSLAYSDFVKAALQSEWPRIKLILAAVARAKAPESP